MKKLKIFAQAIAWAFLLFLLVPALWYSLRTPFALIDDFYDWSTFFSLHTLSGLITWFHETWLHPQHRFRMTFDLYQFVTWGLWGGNSVLHHAFRWMLKALVVGTTFYILRLLASTRRLKTGMPFWVFGVIYIFFPNNPEARLAPAELISVTFLALFLYEICRLCVEAQGDLNKLSLGRYGWMVIVFTAMLWSKEPNILLGTVLLVLLACINLNRWMRLLPFIVIVTLSGIRIWAASRTGLYWHVPLTRHLIYDNIIFYTQSLFLFKTSWVCTGLLIVPSLAGLVWLVVQTWKTRLKAKGIIRGSLHWLGQQPVLEFYWLVFLSIVVTYGGLLIITEKGIRYFYPLVYLLALWVSLAILAFQAFSSRWRILAAGIAIMGSIYFIGANYYNFVYQFATQYYTRQVEEDVLLSSERVLKGGWVLSINLDEENDLNILCYFNQYLPFYKHTPYRITVGAPHTANFNGCYYLTPHVLAFPIGLQWDHEFYYCHVSRLLSRLDKISSWFQFGHPAYYWFDPGATDMGRHGEDIPIWYIYDSSKVWGSSQ